MNKEKFEEWLETHFPGHRFMSPRLMAFLGIYGQMASPISIKAAQAWLVRNHIPEKVVLLLPQIAARVAQPITLHQTFVIWGIHHGTFLALERTAAQAQSTPAQLLALCLRIGFEDQCGIE